MCAVSIGPDSRSTCGQDARAGICWRHAQIVMETLTTLPAAPLRSCQLWCLHLSPARLSVEEDPGGTNIKSERKTVAVSNVSLRMAGWRVDQNEICIGQ